MEILSLLKLALNYLTLGAMCIFLLMITFSGVSCLISKTWYWNKFIPKLHDFEDRYPRLTTVLLLYIILFTVLGVSLRYRLVLIVPR